MQHRILRVLEYVGTPEWVRYQIDRREVKGRHYVNGGQGYIQEAILGETPEVVENPSKYHLSPEDMRRLRAARTAAAPEMDVVLDILERVTGATIEEYEINVSGDD